MNEDIREVLKLLPVRTAPFFAAGMFLCAQGGAKALAFILAGLVAVVLVYLLFRKGFASAVAMFAGMAFMMGYLMLVIQPVLAYSGSTQLLACKVTDKYDYGGYASYECRTTIAGRVTSISLYSDSSFEIGDSITAEITLSEKESTSASPVRKCLMRGTIEKIVDVQRPVFSISRSMCSFRQRLSDEVAVYLDDDVGALAQGLLFGDTSDFSLELSHAAKVSGIIHFTAVSGSHFIIIMSVMLELFGKGKRARAIVSAICIPLTVLFFGADPSVLRSGIMLFLCNCGPLVARRSDVTNSLCVAVFVMVVTAPYILLNVGFQMSVMGVFGVAVIGSRCNRMLHSAVRMPVLLSIVCDMIVVSACAVICIAPISVPMFGGVSLVGTFATVVLTPTFTAALIIGVLYALSGISLFIFPIAVFVKASYSTIMFFGSDSRSWLAMDFEHAELLALASALALIAAVFFSRSFLTYGLSILSLTVSAAILLSVVAKRERRMVDFVSDGTNGAAVLCVKDEAVIYLCGDVDDMPTQLADCLLRNGIHHVRYAIVTDLSYTGAMEYAELNKIYPTDIMIVSDNAEILQDYCGGVQISERKLSSIVFDGVSIATAKAGDTECDADIVIYTGYKMSEPQYGAKLIPLYASSRQNILPEGGINIYDNNFELIMEK